MDSLIPHPVLDSQYEFLRVLVVPDNPHIVIVALNRPKKHHALHRPLWKEIGQIFSVLGTLGDDARAVILTSTTARSFCAGIDVTEPSFFVSQQQQKDVAHTALQQATAIRDMQSAFTKIEQCPLPVVAAIHGHCIGAGVDLICCADIRLCDENSASFAVAEVALGLAADVGTLQRLPKIVGNVSWVYDVCYTGRAFDGKEALEMGLVSRCCSSSSSVLQEALTLARHIVRHSPVAVQGTKASLLYARDHTVADGLDMIRLYNASALQGQDMVVGMKTRKKKQSPKYNAIPKLSKL